MVAILCTGAGVLAQTATLVDPPERVAQLNYFDGPVSFAPAGHDQWAGAVLNRPLTQGDRIWNDAGARSELHIDSTALRLEGSTSLSFSSLNDRTVQIAMTQGRLIARLRSLPPGQSFEIDTPNLAFSVSRPGDYRLDVDPATDTTRITVRAGSAVLYGGNGTSTGIAANDQITFAGNDLAQVAAQTAPALDPFDRWAAARDVEEDRSVSARYVSRDIIGYQQLDQYGSWESDPSYGDVWVPRVTVPDWAPYRIGHWATVAPWGWTWIDDAPWGFAPFHYGRWTQLGTRWCWVPGARNVRPVYAPALVAFVGGGVGVNFNISVGGAVRPGVAWFPLAPGEAWHPWFRANPIYVNNVNSTLIVHNVTNITNVTNVYRYQHLPMAVTAVTAAAFTQGQHVLGNTRPVTVAELQRARVTSPPAPTLDPRSVFGASRVTQAHPAPPAAAVDRRVVSSLAFDRGRAGTPSGREALPAPLHGFGAPGAEKPATPALPSAGAELAKVPRVSREPFQRSALISNEVTPATRQAAPAQPQSAVTHQPPAQQHDQLPHDQLPHDQLQSDQAAPMQQDQARREQFQNEQAARSTQVQLQKVQDSQRAQQQMRQAQMSQRVQLEHQLRQNPGEAQTQRPRSAQEKRGAQAAANGARHKPAGEAPRRHREGQRPAKATEE
ncbi:MAG: DUF6600 domain-containing protein [Burkholderiaceae bacterium]